MGTENEEELYKRQMELERLRVEIATQQRAKELEDLRKAQEQQGKMVADDPAVASWPDDGFQAAQGRLDAVKGALGIGAPGDAAFAGRLLNDGRPPAAEATAATRSDGAKERPGVAPNARGAAPAFGR